MNLDNTESLPKEQTNTRTLMLRQTTKKKKKKEKKKKNEKKENLTYDIPWQIVG